MLSTVRNRNGSERGWAPKDRSQPGEAQEWLPDRSVVAFTSISYQPISFICSIFLLFMVLPQVPQGIPEQNNFNYLSLSQTFFCLSLPAQTQVLRGQNFCLFYTRMLLYFWCLEQGLMRTRCLQICVQSMNSLIPVVELVSSPSAERLSWRSVWTSASVQKCRYALLLPIFCCVIQPLAGLVRLPSHLPSHSGITQHPHCSNLECLSSSILMFLHMAPSLCLS